MKNQNSQFKTLHNNGRLLVFQIVLGAFLILGVNRVSATTSTFSLSTYGDDGYSGLSEAGDTLNQLTNTNVYGITSDNTDNGKLYWNLLDQSGTKYLRLYKDLSKTQLVLEGTGTGNITLTEQNSSGLSGSASVVYTSDDTDSGNIISSDWSDFSSIYVPMGTSNDRYAFFRFEINIPKGATITSAYLTFVAANNFASDAAVEINLLDESDSAAFSTGSGNPILRATTGSVTGMLGNWTKDTRYGEGDVPDIKGLIQSFINRSDYDYNSHIGLRLKRNGSTNTKTAYGAYSTIDSSNWPKLIVNYTSGDPVLTVRHAHPSSFEKQTFRVNVVNPGTGNKLVGLLDGSTTPCSPNSQALVAGDMTIVCDYTSLTAGSHTVTIKAVNGSDSDISSTIYTTTWTTTHNGRPYVSIDQNNSLKINGNYWFPIGLSGLNAGYWKNNPNSGDDMANWFNFSLGTDISGYTAWGNPSIAATARAVRDGNDSSMYAEGESRRIGFIGPAASMNTYDGASGTYRQPKWHGLDFSFNETFEGSGYVLGNCGTGFCWTSGSGVDADYAADPLDGSQSLLLDGETLGSESNTTLTFKNFETYTGIGRVKVSMLLKDKSTAGRPATEIARILSADNTIMGKVIWNANGTFTLQQCDNFSSCQSNETDSTTASCPPGTLCKLWIDYEGGSSNDSTYDNQGRMSVYLDSDSAVSLVINSFRDELVFKYDGGNETTIHVADGTYSGTTLAAALQTSINAAFSISSTVSYSDATKRFTFTAPSGHTFEYYHPLSDMGKRIGFSQSHSAANSITTDDMVGFEPLQYYGNDWTPAYYCPDYLEGGRKNASTNANVACTFYGGSGGASKPTPASKLQLAAGSSSKIVFDDVEDWMEDLKDNIDVLKDYTRYPNMYAWFWDDEPDMGSAADWNSNYGVQSRFVKTIDTSHPTWGLFYGGNYDYPEFSAGDAQSKYERILPYYNGGVFNADVFSYDYFVYHYSPKGYPDFEGMLDSFDWVVDKTYNSQPIVPVTEMGEVADSMCLGTSHTTYFYESCTDVNTTDQVPISNISGTFTPSRKALTVLYNAVYYNAAYDHYGTYDNRPGSNTGCGSGGTESCWTVNPSPGSYVAWKSGTYYRAASTPKYVRIMNGGSQIGTAEVLDVRIVATDPRFADNYPQPHPLYNDQLVINRIGSWNFDDYISDGNTWTVQECTDASCSSTTGISATISRTVDNTKVPNFYSADCPTSPSYPQCHRRPGGQAWIWWTPMPTTNGIKNVFWNYVIHGAKGVQGFQRHVWNWFLNKAAFKDDKDWIDGVGNHSSSQAMGPVVLQAPSSRISSFHATGWTSATMSGNGRVDYTAREYNGKTYVIAARVSKHTGDQSTADTATMNISDLENGTSIAVLGEGRNLTSSTGSFQDSFDQADVHIYELDSLIPSDSTPPTVTAFTIPETSTSLNVPITSFSATDDSGTVTGYLLTESATTPDVGDPNWSSTVQSQFTFSTEGAKTLYAWAKDAAGNISSSLSDSVTITLPTYTIGGTMSGLMGTAVLKNNGGDDLTVSSNGSFTFGTALYDSDTYSVIVSDQPDDQTCSVTNGSGTVSGANVTNISITCVDGADSIAPIVTAFSLPLTSDSLTVPVTEFTANDNASVTGYLLTESSSPPSVGDAGWEVTAPAEYTFSSEGAKTLYAWAKDGSGNVSESLNASVAVILDAQVAGVSTKRKDDHKRDLDVHSVKFSSTATSFTVTWKTDYKANSKVKYGFTKEPKIKKKSSKKKKSHSITIKNLLPDKLYYFKASSTDEYGNEDKSKVYMVRTGKLSWQPR